MMRSMFAGVSGLRNHLVRLDVIGNNIANVNTTGFKNSRVTFQDMLAQVLRSGTAPTEGGAGGTNPSQVGLGMVVGAIDTLHSQGNLSSTGKTTDVAIQGNGFFVMSNGTTVAYSRDGAFDIGLDGDLVNPGSGYRVQGWTADSNGVIDSTQTVDDINIPIGQTEIAQQTSTLKLAGNINASATDATIGTVAKSGAVYSDAAGTTAAVAGTALTSLYDGTNGTALLAGGDVITLGGYKGGAALSPERKVVGTDVSTYGDLLTWINQYFGIASGESYDYSGAAVNSGVSIDAATAGAALIKGNKGEGNALTQISLTAETAAGVDKTLFNGVMDDLATTQQDADGSSVSTSMTVYDSQGASHSIKFIFTRIGANQWSWTVDCADDVSGGRCVISDGAIKDISFTTAGAFSSKTGTINIDLTNATDITIDPTMATLTQFAGTSSVSLSEQNGYPKGTLEKFSVGNNGLITGIYTNGLTKTIAQIALASFANPGGLVSDGNNLFKQSTNSGAAQIGVAGNGGRGLVNSGFLEMSNVDLAQAFTDMIVTQRGFQANARTITISDEMLQELVNLKR
ncbi:MAG: flagellar hook protein FlgE [Candidatus Omnitrophica bacterium]|nr:flagellar hook protein FlgE [Candidatus Omnitrophota bacterium]